MREAGRNASSRGGAGRSMEAAMQAMLMVAAARVLLTSVRRRLAALRATLDRALAEMLAE
jgi:hypothetical protein